MKKSTFLNLIVGVIGGQLFGVGICMCLLPEWNAFKLGVAVATVGAVVLMAQAIATYVNSGKRLKINWKLTGKVLYGIFGALVLGAGMCMIMVWEMMLLGIVVGIVGIVLLLCLIPMCIGLKE